MCKIKDASVQVQSQSKVEGVRVQHFISIKVQLIIMKNYKCSSNILQSNNVSCTAASNGDRGYLIIYQNQIQREIAYHNCQKYSRSFLLKEKEKEQVNFKQRNGKIIHSKKKRKTDCLTFLRLYFRPFPSIFMKRRTTASLVTILNNSFSTQQISL